MADPTAFFQCTWGRLKLWLAEISTDNSRDVVVHRLSRSKRRGDNPTSDRGPREGRSRCKLLFDDFPGELTPTELFRRLKAQVDSEQEHMFQHPLDGRYMARVGEFSYVIDEDSNIRDVSIEFIASEPIDSISPAGAGTSSALSESNVSQAADDLDAELADVFLEATVADRARTAVESWSAAETVPTRQVLVESAGITDEVSILIEDGGLEDDIELFGSWRASVMLGDAVRSAAIAATSEVAATYTIRVVMPLPLLPLMARIYGGDEAEDRARQATELNDIRTPGWIEPGVYTLPRKTLSARTLL
jgi:hypothetical protein